MPMTVARLRELLDQYDDNTEVRLATQPSWPLAFNIRGVTDSTEMAGETQCEDHGLYNCDDCAPEANVVWIVEGGHPYDDSPYAPRAAWEAVTR